MIGAEGAADACELDSKGRQCELMAEFSGSFGWPPTDTDADISFNLYRRTNRGLGIYLCADCIILHAR